MLVGSVLIAAVVAVGVISFTGINYSLGDCKTKVIKFITAQCPEFSCV